MLRHPHRPRRHAEYVTCLFGRKTRHYAEGEQFALMAGQQREQCPGALCLGVADHGFLGPGTLVRAVWQVLGGNREPDGAAQGICHFVCRDPEDERGERAPHVTVSGQRGENRDTHLLRDIVGDVVVAGDPAKARTAVSDDHWPQLLDERFDRARVPLHRKISQIP